MKKLLLLFCLLISSFLFAQTGYYKTLEICNDNAYGNNVHALTNSVLVVSSGSRGRCLSLIKLDDSGNEIMNVEYPTRDSFQRAIFFQTSIIDKNGDLVIASPYNNYYFEDSLWWDILITKYDTATLDITWEKHFQSYSNEKRIAIQETDIGYRLMLQKTYPVWDVDHWFADKQYVSFEEFDYEGNPIRKDEILPSSEQYHWSKSFTKEINGNTAIAYNAGPYSTSQNQFISIVDSNFNVVWTKMLADRIVRIQPSVSLSKDQQYIYVSSYKEENDIPPFFFSEHGKIYAYNINGNLVWEKSLLVEEGRYFIENIRTLKNGQIACAGWQRANASGRLSLLNEDGTLVWDNRYRLDNITGSNVNFYDIDETEDGDIVAVGSYSTPFTDKKILILKVDRTTGCLDENCELLVDSAPTPVSSIDDKTSPNEHQVFPNPNNGQFQIIAKGGSNSFQVTIFDINGKLIYQNNHVEDKETLSLPENVKGIHFLKLIDEEGNLNVEKIIVE